MLVTPDFSKHPVMYIRRNLRCSTVEKECLAIKWALETLKYYLLGWHYDFSLVVDHAPLVWMSRNKDSNARVTCWFLSLQPLLSLSSSDQVQPMERSSLQEGTEISGSLLAPVPGPI
jgi:hypothetical protein